MLIVVLQLCHPDAQLESFALHCWHRDDDTLNNYIIEPLRLYMAFLFAVICADSRLTWKNEQSKKYLWTLPLSMDEKDQRFTGRGKFTSRCKLKKEGDGCFMDSAYEWRHVLVFCPRNQHPPKKWRSLSYSPTHSRTLLMSDQLETNSNHRLLMDNIFIYAKISRVDDRIKVK